MLKILWKRGKIAPEEQFLPLSTIFYYLVLDFYVKIGIRFYLRDKRLFEITEVEITRVDCTGAIVFPVLDKDNEPSCFRETLNKNSSKHCLDEQLKKEAHPYKDNVSISLR